MIRTAIVDDEPVAREGLRLWLASEPDIEVVGEAGDPGAAVALLQRERPELVFLDVQMPEADGFTVLERIGAEYLPEVIFVTAHERHALRAFEVSALDFLLKPVREERFRAALGKARRELAREDEREGPARLSALLREVRQPAGGKPPRLERFVVRVRDRYRFVPVSEVRWIAAAGNYAELHVAGGTHLVRATLTELEAGLDPAEFVRIHRGTLVRLACVREVVPASHGDCDVLLQGSDEVLKLSRRYRARLLPG